jgi:Raf kinase inhibitor-like YbhB/YbcL family protein
MRAAYISHVTRWVAGLIACGVAVLAGCGGGGSESAPAGHIAVRSHAFADGQTIPTAYTCSGKDISPPLSWSGVPSGAARLTLQMNDLTAHFLHWKVTGIEPGTREVAAGRTPAGGTAGKNAFGKVGYGGPCPPRGDDPHRYAFTVVALGRDGKVLDRGSLVGTFSRD